MIQIEKYKWLSVYDMTSRKIYIRLYGINVYVLM